MRMYGIISYDCSKGCFSTMCKLLKIVKLLIINARDLSVYCPVAQGNIQINPGDSTDIALAFISGN